MPLRGDRIHRYVNAFCPLATRSARTVRWPRCGGCPAGWSSATAGSGWSAAAPTTAWSARCTTSRRRSCATSSSGPRRPRCTRPTWPATSSRCRRPTRDGLPEMQTQHTCILLEDITRPLQPAAARPASPTPSPALAAVAPLDRGARLDRRAAVPGERPHRRADALAAASRRSTRGWPSCSTRWPRARSCGSWSTPTACAIAQDDALLDLLRRAPRAGRGLPAVRRRVGRGVHAPPRRRHPPVQGAGDRAALRARGSSPR